MSGKRHTMTEAREAKQSVRDQLSGFEGVSLGIGESNDGADYAVVVMVANEAAKRSLPHLDAKIPVQVEVVGKIAAY